MEEIKSMINKIGKNITKTSKDIIKNTKLSMRLSSQEEKLKNVYIEIGKKVYEIYSYGGNIGEYFDEKYKQMLDIEKEISIIKQKIEENKNLGNTVNINQDVIDTRVNISSVEECRICQSCGQKNNVNDKFCLKCGRVL
ncbi:zinc ribbon domain-containing protein [uncultured Tyzzerella sp.]|uniref:zinc ribbon domain-containing protein n=1 Tax=uncultured Tyzzerella sp. TaxID=2321398 RepID=UPI002941DC8F|nr:zinc ribbon domain-containing protein [uncultured Tyzzerella sp.]